MLKNLKNSCLNCEYNNANNKFSKFIVYIMLLYYDLCKTLSIDNFNFGFEILKMNLVKKKIFDPSIVTWFLRVENIKF